MSISLDILLVIVGVITGCTLVFILLFSKKNTKVINEEQPIALPKIPLSTTDKIDGFAIRKNMGVVYGRAVIGLNMLGNAKASFKNRTLGGSVDPYYKVLDDVVKIAINDMCENAKHADAIVGVRIDTDSTVLDGIILNAMVYGTAVLIEKDIKPDP